MYGHGWFKVAFERDLTGPITPAVIGSQRLVLVRTETGIRAFNADCPHRGAHLAYGGRLDGQCIVCPFHGYRIGLGEAASQGFYVAEYPTLALGGLVFVRLSDTHDYGFSEFITRLATDHVFVPGFEIPVKVPAAVIIENAFDYRHFHVVHRVATDKFTVSRADDGHLMLRSAFIVPAGPIINGQMPQMIQKAFTAHTFSPGIIISHVGGDMPHTVMTAATPQPDGTCILRLSLALSVEHYGATPDPELCARMVAGNREGLEPDLLIWDHLSVTAPQRLTPQDLPIAEFQKFCQEFEPLG